MMDYRVGDILLCNMYTSYKNNDLHLVHGHINSIYIFDRPNIWKGEIHLNMRFPNFTFLHNNFKDVPIAYNHHSISTLIARKII
jgi:hypothetical protein